MQRRLPALAAIIVGRHTSIRIYKVLQGEHGNPMIEKDLAIDIQEQALRAIEMLTEILNLDMGQCSPDEYMR